MPEAPIHAQTNVGRARAAATNNGSGYSVYDPVGHKIGIAERVMGMGGPDPDVPVPEEQAVEPTERPSVSPE